MSPTARRPPEWRPASPDVDDTRAAADERQRQVADDLHDEEGEQLSDLHNELGELWLDEPWMDDVVEEAEEAVEKFAPLDWYRALGDLPIELLELILRQLPRADLRRASESCHALCAAALRVSPALTELPRPLLARVFGELGDGELRGLAGTCRAVREAAADEQRRRRWDELRCDNVSAHCACDATGSA